ncbi:hypothetical protein SERLA73DRAFT_76300 [Serpula lacrymans var. lacrymans S7.3]|uniref:Uncharacterized protein n=2 Tax=Serpula lacrymans var. lacrymans TaxID=341189 RepID=F8Q6T3_SERL3|nr:uncharacterized protein SERLADRAFT_441092 [Serpula lacrymans var. lacrymans S7.9]EGN96321.1 hypothetical protein SERLA73DRAFT_76300 [Serpula lacrymans var. lacrymans S7.3]EGO21858.1 hypothetical protein SERLADRAFT_441092 [Serpula lacrymans var. lacrymans S7.9]
MPIIVHILRDTLHIDTNRIDDTHHESVSNIVLIVDLRFYHSSGFYAQAFVYFPLKCAAPAPTRIYLAPPHPGHVLRARFRPNA